MKLDIKEITEEVNKKAAEYIAQVCHKNKSIDINQIIELRKAFMNGAIAVLLAIKGKVEENAKAE